MSTATITITLPLEGEVTPAVVDALHSLADIMLVQAEDGLWRFGSPDAEGQEGPGDSGIFIENDKLLEFGVANVSVEVSPMSEIQIIAENRHSTKQGYLLDRTVKADAARIRIEVYRDSFDYQSYARASLWSGTEWNIVATLRGEEPDMAGPSEVGWNKRRDDPQHTGARTHHEDCVEWQDRIADRLMTTVLAVIE